MPDDGTPCDHSIAENLEGLTIDQRRAWAREKALTLRDYFGCRWFRYSSHEENPNYWMVEGWHNRPDVEGPSRWGARQGSTLSESAEQIH